MDKDSSMVSDFKIGTLVFAKMKGFPYWPGVITSPTDELKKASSSRKSSHCIFFFGSRNYSLVEQSNLKLYSENKDLLQKKQTVSLKKAFDEMEDYIKRDLTVSALLSTEDPFDSLLSTPDSTPKRGDKAPVKRKAKSLGSEIEEKKRRPSTGVRASARLSEINLPKFIAPKPANIQKQPKPKQAKGKIVGKVKVAEPKKITELSSNDDQITPSSTKKEDNFTFYASSSSKSLIPRPESPPLIFEKVSDNLGEEPSEPSLLNFGFIGLGKMGSAMVNKLLESKHNVTIWNRTQEKCQPFIEVGAQSAPTPGDVIEGSDITFCCVSDNESARDIVFGECGVLPKITTCKSYVEMSGISHSVSREIAEAISAAGGRYLEVRFHGSKVRAENGTLVLMAAGDRTLYDDCSSCFNAFSAQKSFLGEVGKASQMVPILNSHFATLLTGFSEVIEVGKGFGIPQEAIFEYFKKSRMLNPSIIEKCQASLRGDIPCDMTISDLQKYTFMTHQLASDLEEVTPLLSTTNEFLKKCIRIHGRDEDVCKVVFLT